MIILATLRGEFEDQPGEIGNFARRFWRIAGKVDNFTREIWKSRRPSAERVAHWCQDVAAWARDRGLQPRGGGRSPDKGFWAQGSGRTYENKSEGFCGQGWLRACR